MVFLRRKSAKRLNDNYLIGFEDAPKIDLTSVFLREFDLEATPYGVQTSANTKTFAYNAETWDRKQEN